MLVDSHCHLDFAELNNGLDEVVKRASDSAIVLMQSICTQISKFESILSITQKYDMVYCSVGNHPLYVKKEKFASHEDILVHCSLPKVIGIGETGLDYYHPDFDKALQQKNFIEHIKASQESGLPIIVHTRAAEEDTVSILKEHMRKKKFTGVIHCFTSSKWLATECINMGLYISASGILTFKNAVDIQQTFKDIPEDKILIETDSPFLAPVPLRGKSNEPSYLKHTALFLAHLRGKSFEEISKITTDNFFNLFRYC